MWRVRGDQFAIFTFQFVYSSRDDFVPATAAPPVGSAVSPSVVASERTNERVKDDVVGFFSLNDAVRKFYEQFWKHCFVVGVRLGRGHLRKAIFSFNLGFLFCCC